MYKYLYYTLILYMFYIVYRKKCSDRGFFCSGTMTDFKRAAFSSLNVAIHQSNANSACCNCGVTHRAYFTPRRVRSLLNSESYLLPEQ